MGSVAYEYTDPELSAAMFEISNGDDLAYADTVAAAYLAYWTLRKDRGTMGTTVTIRNTFTGTVVWSD